MPLGDLHHGCQWRASESTLAAPQLKKMTAVAVADTNFGWRRVVEVDITLLLCSFRIRCPCFITGAAKFGTAPDSFPLLKSGPPFHLPVLQLPFIRIPAELFKHM